MKKEVKNMLTVEDVADIFNVSTTTVNKWINSNDLPALKVGTVRRIYIDDLKKFFEKFYTGEEIPNSFPISDNKQTIGVFQNPR